MKEKKKTLSDKGIAGDTFELIYFHNDVVDSIVNLKRAMWNRKCTCIDCTFDMINKEFGKLLIERKKKND